MKDFLLKLRESPEFQVVMAEIGKHRPVVPRWKPVGGKELMENIKYQSAMQEGFDLLHNLLTGKTPPDRA